MKYITIPTSNDYLQWYDKKYYVDKTGELAKLEGTLVRGSAIFFARPRRWGKSLFFSMTNYFFNKDLYKKEYFKGKKIEESEILAKKAGKYFVISLDLKPIYDKDSNSLNWDKLWTSFYEQLPKKYLESIFGNKKSFFEKIFGLKKEKTYKEKQEEINYLKSKYDLGEYIKKFVESWSKQEDILLLIDEYDKPVNDCLKYKKNELGCKKQVLEELKDKLYRYLKDIPCITMITGINKLSMSSFFSDFNNLSDYSYLVNLGFSEEETKKLFNNLEVEYRQEIKKWYNGYNFKGYGNTLINEFNPWAINEYLKYGNFESFWSKTGTAPDYFRYLIKDVLKINSFEEYLKLIEKEKYTDKVINLELINELNPLVIMHYFYYAGLLTITEKNFFAIPNNDVIFAYEDLIFASTETQTYIDLRTKATDAIEKLSKDTSYFVEFIKYLLHTKYINQDKSQLNKIGEQVITSDVALILNTFIRLDLRREVNILEGRTDIEYLDQYNKKVLLEFKIVKKSEEINKKKEEAIKQIEKYNKLKKYDYSYIIIIDLEKLDVLVERIEV